MVECCKAIYSLIMKYFFGITQNKGKLKVNSKKKSHLHSS